MPHAITSSSKRKGGKVGHMGGLGGPGGRGSRRKTLQPAKGARVVELSHDLLQLRPHDLAVEIARRVAEGAGAWTPYRTAMSAISIYANRHSRTMKPEVRTKLARAKDELRELFDRPHKGKGKGGRGAKRVAKPKVKSRRNPRR